LQCGKENHQPPIGGDFRQLQDRQSGLATPRAASIPKVSPDFPVVLNHCSDLPFLSAFQSGAEKGEMSTNTTEFAPYCGQTNQQQSAPDLTSPVAETNWQNPSSPQNVISFNDGHCLRMMRGKRDHEKTSDKKIQSKFSFEPLMRSGTCVVAERSEQNVPDKSVVTSKAGTTEALQESQVRLQGVVVGPNDVTALGQEQARAASFLTQELPGDATPLGHRQAGAASLLATQLQDLMRQLFAFAGSNSADNHEPKAVEISSSRVNSLRSDADSRSKTALAEQHDALRALLLTDATSVQFKSHQCVLRQSGSTSFVVTFAGVPPQQEPNDRFKGGHLTSFQ